MIFLDETTIQSVRDFIKPIGFSLGYDEKLGIYVRAPLKKAEDGNPRPYVRKTKAMKDFIYRLGYTPEVEVLSNGNSVIYFGPKLNKQVGNTQ